MPTIQLSPTASVILVASYIISTLIMVVLTGAIAYLLSVFNRTLKSYEERLDPLLTKTEAVLTMANSMLETIGGKTESILTQGEMTAETVHDRVEKTAVMVQKTVNAPLIGINALSAGLMRGVKTFGSLQSKVLPTANSAATAVVVTPVVDEVIVIADPVASPKAPPDSGQVQNVLVGQHT